MCGYALVGQWLERKVEGLVLRFEFRLQQPPRLALRLDVTRHLGQSI